MTESDSHAAERELRALLASGIYEAEAADLIRLADTAASRIADAEQREKLAEQLIEALTVVRFSPVFGTDAAPGRARAIRLLDVIGG